MCAYGRPISTLSSLSPSDESVDASQVVQYLFYIFSMLTVLASMHVILCTVFVCNWAPGLALRGPTGSMSRAYDATRGERKQINVMYIFSLFCFAVQTVLTIWILDGTSGVTIHGIIATMLTAVAIGSCTWYLNRMHKAFFGRTDATPQARSA